MILLPKCYIFMIINSKNVKFSAKNCCSYEKRLLNLWHKVDLYLKWNSVHMQHILHKTATTTTSTDKFVKNINLNNNPIKLNTRISDSAILSLLMSYIYGATSRARTVSVVYISTYIWQRWQLSIFISCTMYQHWMNAERFPLICS